MATPVPTGAAPARRTTVASQSLILMIVPLYFVFGGLTSLNDVLIPKLKALFSLSYTEVMLTQFVFFGAYFLLSLPGGVLVSRAGYLRGIAISLLIMAVGSAAFVPASGSGIYMSFLAALFVLAVGITILQVAVNPLIIALGPPETSSSRLTLAQAFNSLGTTVFPYVGARVILGSATGTDTSRFPPAQLLAFHRAQAAVVGHAYIAIAVVLLLIAAAFWLIRRRPAPHTEETAALGASFALLKYPRLAFGVGSIFLYVGAEVAIGSIMTSYLMQKSVLALTPESAGKMLSFYWGGAMVGRFIGSYVLRIFSPGKVLATVALVAAVLAFSSSHLTGGAAGWTLLSVGLMNSIMFPTIFSLAVEGLGEQAAEASGLICVAIVGGAVVPLITGRVADAAGLAAALLVPMVCYLLIASFGWYARKPAAVVESSGLAPTKTG